MRKPIIAERLRRFRAGPQGGGLTSPGGSIGNILDNVLASPLDAAINQTYANWDWMTRPYPGPIRPPWAGQFGKRPWPMLNGVPWRPGRPWIPGAQSLAIGLALQWMFQPPGLRLAADGWTLCCDAGLPILDGIYQNTHGQNGPCQSTQSTLCGLSGQLTGSNWVVQNASLKVGRNIYLGMKTLSGTRQTHGQIWSTGRTLVPATNLKGPQPAIPVDPLVQPGDVYAPTVDPAPPIDPYREPAVTPMGDPSPPAYPDRMPVAMPTPFPREYNYIPVITIEPGPDVGGPTKPPRPPNEDEGPVKERKLILAINKTTFIGTVLNAVTEAVDFIECFYEALPAKIRREFERKNGIYGKVSPQMKLLALWQRFDHLDWNAVVHNLAVNQLEDKFFGKIGKVGAVANRIKDNYMGYGTGGFQLGYAM